MFDFSFIRKSLIYIEALIDLFIIMFKNKFDLDKTNEEVSDMLIKERRRDWDRKRIRREYNEALQKRTLAKLKEFNEALDERIKELESKESEKTTG